MEFETHPLTLQSQAITTKSAPFGQKKTITKIINNLKINTYKKNSYKINKLPNNKNSLSFQKIKIIIIIMKKIIIK